MVNIEITLNEDNVILLLCCQMNPQPLYFCIVFFLLIKTKTQKQLQFQDLLKSLETFAPTKTKAYRKKKKKRIIHIDIETSDL